MRVLLVVLMVIGLLVCTSGPAVADRIWITVGDESGQQVLMRDIITPDPTPAPMMINDILLVPDSGPRVDIEMTYEVDLLCGSGRTLFSLNRGPPTPSLLKTL